MILPSLWYNQNRNNYIVMNIHPIFVHFPVAFLTVYSLAELIRFRAVLSQSYWFYIKAVLVIVGSLGSLAALITGGMAEDLIPRTDTATHNLIDMHSTWAGATVAFFGVLAICYVVSWTFTTGRFNPARPWVVSIWNILIKVKHVLLETKFIVVLALIGLVLVTVTGAFGGSIAYKGKTDPFAAMLYKTYHK